MLMLILRRLMSLRSLALKTEKDEETKKHLQNGLEFLKKRLPEIKDSFVLANFALASVEMGDVETAPIIVEKLSSLAQTENETLFWTTANTPFHGWGTTAKIETTALVVQVLLKSKVQGSKSKVEDLTSRAVGVFAEK